MAGISAANLLNCRDASMPMLLRAFNMIANDDNGEVKQLFFAVGRQRLKLLRWVLTAIDPSGETERELGAGDGTGEALIERISSVLKKQNPARTQEFAAFAEGTAADNVQRRLWHMLLGTAEMVQNSESSSPSSPFSRPCSGDTTFEPTVASSPIPQAEPSAVSSLVKREEKATKRLWHSDDGAGPSDKSTAAEEDPLDGLIKQLEESIAVDKAKLAAAAASPDPEEPPLDPRLCASYRQAAERLVKAGESLMQGPPSRLPPLVLNDEDGKLVAAAREALEALRSNLLHATLLNALEGRAKIRPRDTRFK
ncbi:uncharacterized protein [Dermacentor albipictus]|uniref:uncharacterized protein n=1 Tax=Dermacentor albipictus TaxID=60249 RepID=UPI0038FC47FF